MFYFALYNVKQQCALRRNYSCEAHTSYNAEKGVAECISKRMTR